ncbi:hypothetical protein C8R43DRAFT_1174557 [Mycena crocata]|nr:hypothetical protein C8R43DRAFT_1174557 [Mycena crocata]
MTTARPTTPPAAPPAMVPMGVEVLLVKAVQTAEAEDAALPVLVALDTAIAYCVVVFVVDIGGGVRQSAQDQLQNQDHKANVEVVVVVVEQIAFPAESRATKHVSPNTCMVAVENQRAKITPEYATTYGSNGIWTSNPVGAIIAFARRIVWRQIWPFGQQAPGPSQ